MKAKFLSFLLTVMLCASYALAETTVTFTSSDFEGQGTSGTGSAVSAYKNGVSFSCDKGYGDQYGVRCYKTSNVSISSSYQTISSISFSFNTVGGTTYNGGLSENISVNAYSWDNTMASQARMNTITVYLNDESGPSNYFSGPTDISQYTDEGIVKVFSDNNNINIPITYLAFEKNSHGSPMNCIVVQSPSGVESILYSPNLYSTTSDEDFIPYLYEANGYIYIDLQRKEAGTWHLMLVQEYAGNWLYYNNGSPSASGESTFWNFSDAAFNSLGTISTTTTVNGLTIHASSDKNIVIDEGSVREIDGLSFSYRLKFGGSGSTDARMLSFPVSGHCKIDIYLISSSSAADRILNVDAEYMGNTLQQIPAYGTEISKGTVNYTGGATTIYLYSPSSGVNIYAIRVTYNNSSTGTTVTQSDLAGYQRSGYYVACFQAPANSTCNDIVWAGSYNNWATDDVSQLVHCDPLPNFPGWYVAVVPTGNDNSGKPVQLDECGLFNWDNQCGGINEVALLAGYVYINISINGDEECNLDYWSSNEPTIITISSWQNGANPCNQTCTPKYTITTESANPEWGSATGGKTAEYLDQVTISANANFGYHFTQWNDGNTDNPRAVTVIEDATYTASFAKNNYTITTTSANQSWGSATGGKTAPYLDQITITANANYGYRFTQWNDGNTENPRTITVTENETFIASFAKNNYTVTTTSENPSGGSVTGGKTVAYLSQITITASANYGYHFTQWNDGNKENPRTVTVTENAIYTASFAKNNYTITTNSENPLWGSATGGKTAEYLDQVTISANANYGYHFTQWNDGNTQNPRTVTVIENATYTASFDINIYTVNVTSEDNKIGMVIGSGMYEAFTEVNVMAAACQDGYKWSHWSDGVQLAGRKVVLTSDTTLVAHFTNDEEACVEVDVNNQSLGQADILVMATPNEGARFVQWEDGETSNPRVVTYLAPAKYIAIFTAGNNPSSIAPLSTSQEDGTMKIIRDNQVYILRGDKIYTVTGQEVK